MHWELVYALASGKKFMLLGGPDKFPSTVAKLVGDWSRAMKELGLEPTTRGEAG